MNYSPHPARPIPLIDRATATERVRERRVREPVAKKPPSAALAGLALLVLFASSAAAQTLPVISVDPVSDEDRIVEGDQYLFTIRSNTAVENATRHHPPWRLFQHSPNPEFRLIFLLEYAA